MKLYREVLIESAEQAEALPIGTVALDSSEDGNATDAYAKVRANRWYFTTIEADWLTDAETVGLMHLVPIEAEEETTEMYVFEGGEVTYTTPRRESRPGPARRLVTPWEEA